MLLTIKAPLISIESVPSNRDLSHRDNSPGRESRSPRASSALAFTRCVYMSQHIPLPPSVSLNNLLFITRVLIAYRVTALTHMGSPVLEIKHSMMMLTQLLSYWQYGVLSAGEFIRELNTSEHYYWCEPALGFCYYSA